MLAKIPSRDTQTVVNALIKQAKKLPDHLYQSLTGIAASSSRTTSASRWRPTSRSTSATRTALAARIEREHQPAAAPILPQRNGLISAQSGAVELRGARVNERPRETLGFKTPKEKFQACVASTA